MKMIRTLGPLASFVIHAAIIAAIFTLVEFTTRNAENEIKVSTAEVETVDLEEFEKTLEEIEPPDDITDVFTDTPVDTSTPETESVAESQTSELDNIDVLDSVSPLTLNGMYKGRSAEGRAENSGKYGQNPVTEAAIMRALEWLRINQKPDGSWESAKPVGITGLGLLTFLAHGELPSSAPPQVWPP